MVIMIGTLKRHTRNMGEREILKLLSLVTCACIVLFAIACRADAARGAFPFESGVFEQLMLAVDPQGRVTGFYREEQGTGVTKTCSFFLTGKATSDEISVVTWNDQLFPGTLKAEQDGVKLKIVRGREHPGCGLVLLPQISEGIRFDRVAQTNWVELRVITAQRAYFYSEPVASKKLRSFVVRGNVVGVLSESGEWLQVEYVGEKKTTMGWIRGSEVKKLEPGSASASPDCSISHCGGEQGNSGAMRAAWSGVDGSENAINSYPGDRVLGWFMEGQAVAEPQ
jgi:hypothetical protein